MNRELRLAFDKLLDFLNDEELLDKYSFFEVETYRIDESKIDEDFLRLFQTYENEINNFLKENRELPFLAQLYLLLMISIATDTNFGELDVTQYNIFDSSFKIHNLPNCRLRESMVVENGSYFVRNSNLSPFLEDINIVDKIKIFISLGEFAKLMDDSIEGVFISELEDESFDETDVSIKLEFYAVIVMNKQIHSPINMSPVSYSEFTVDFTKSDIDFSQFDDILLLLSQFNYENRILSKFLILYQILESLEIKKDIVKHIGSGGASVFKVRDFSRLVNDTKGDERRKLNQLLKEFLELSYTDSTSCSVETVRTMYVNLWNHISPRLSNLDSEINLLADRTDNYVQSSNFTNNDSVLKNLTNSIYNIRCSVVHYKTHEFHLDDYNLSLHSNLKSFIENFLIPGIHKMISVAIFFNDSTGVKANPITYSSKHLRLY